MEAIFNLQQFFFTCQSIPLRLYIRKSIRSKALAQHCEAGLQQIFDIFDICVIRLVKVKVPEKYKT